MSDSLITSKMRSLLSSEARVLIVDDNPQYASILRRILQGSLGYSEVVTVESTEDGKRLLQDESSHFDLIFVDYHFPDGNTGGQLLMDLKQNGVLASATSFLITSEPSLENQKEAQAAGARGVVAKPFDSNEIRRQIEKAERARLVSLED